ncbi:MAG: heme A synthase [Alphaproteobacteria bacterium]|nr:MAG: heme A synthase [Alphaproteobacteria bacterium]
MDVIDYQKTKPVALWLYSCAFLVFCIAVVGAITRLTGSGLSIVEWQPVTGVLPPHDAESWNKVFDLYKETPQYQKINEGMSLEDFKSIFFWEWFHRLLGRAVGAVYLLPLLIFLAMKRIPRIYLPSFAGFFLLGGAQGVLGWYMVKSGLIDMPAVSHYRLAAHLSLALILFSLLLNMALKLSVPPSKDRALLFPLYKIARRVIMLLAVTIVWGALVAGSKAGLIYNTFPLMGKYPWPTEGLDMAPLWINLFENHATVQFIHRVLATLTALSVLFLVGRSMNFQKSRRVSYAFGLAGALVIVQFTLGVITLLTQLLLPAAVLHQAVAVLLLGSLIWVLHELPPEDYSLDKNDK